jgi:anthranilate phosphoribosyltransferase
MPNPTISFRTAVSRFKKAAAEWLSDEDIPAVQALEAMARELDRKMTPTLLSAYLVAYRALLARKPSGPPAEDELEKALREAERPPQAGTHAQ